MYKSLNDALPAGTTKVWYYRMNENSPSFDVVKANVLKAKKMYGSAEVGILWTHALLGTVEETNPDVLFTALQGERWSPEGEAGDLVEYIGHTSASIGDMVQVGEKLFYCEWRGWKELDLGA